METTEIIAEIKKSRSEFADEFLDTVKGKFDELVVIGVRNNVIDIAPTMPTYQFVYEMLARANFELNITQKANIVAEKTPEAGS